MCSECNGEKGIPASSLNYPVLYSSDGKYCDTFNTQETRETRCTGAVKWNLDVRVGVYGRKTEHQPGMCSAFGHQCWPDCSRSETSGVKSCFSEGEILVPLPCTGHSLLAAVWSSCLERRHFPKSHLLVQSPSG